MCVAECINSGLHPRVKGYNGVADQLLLRAYTCVLHNRSTKFNQALHQPEDQGLQGFDRPTAAASAHTHTHTHARVRARVAEYANSGLHPRIKGYEGLADDMLLRAYTRFCCRINQFKVATGDQRLHRFGRPTAAVSTHVCVAENINSGLHLGPKGQG